MDFPHSKRESASHGGSPGNGMTPTLLSREPIATEGEATPGPDDYNPYEEREFRAHKRQMKMEEEPTEGDDPFVFDDVGASVSEFDFPEIGDGPMF